MKSFCPLSASGNFQAVKSPRSKCNKSFMAVAKEKHRPNILTESVLSMDKKTSTLNRVWFSVHFPL